MDQYDMYLDRTPVIQSIFGVDPTTRSRTLKKSDIKISRCVKDDSDVGYIFSLTLKEKGISVYKNYDGVWIVKFWKNNDQYKPRKFTPNSHDWKELHIFMCTLHKIYVDNDVFKLSTPKPYHPFDKE